MQQSQKSNGRNPPGNNTRTNILKQKDLLINIYPLLAAGSDGVMIIDSYMSMFLCYTKGIPQAFFVMLEYISGLPRG